MKLHNVQNYHYIYLNVRSIMREIIVKKMSVCQLLAISQNSLCKPIIVMMLYLT